MWLFLHVKLTKYELRTYLYTVFIITSVLMQICTACSNSRGYSSCVLAVIVLVVVVL